MVYSLNRVDNVMCAYLFATAFTVTHPQKRRKKTNELLIMKLFQMRKREKYKYTHTQTLSFQFQNENHIFHLSSSLSFFHTFMLRWVQLMCGCKSFIEATKLSTSVKSINKTLWQCMFDARNEEFAYFDCDKQQYYANYLKFSENSTFLLTYFPNIRRRNGKIHL